MKYSNAFYWMSCLCLAAILLVAVLLNSNRLGNDSKQEPSASEYRIVEQLSGGTDDMDEWKRMVIEWQVEATSTHETITGILENITMIILNAPDIAPIATGNGLIAGKAAVAAADIAADAIGAMEIIERYEDPLTGGSWTGWVQHLDVQPDGSMTDAFTGEVVYPAPAQP